MWYAPLPEIRVFADVMIQRKLTKCLNRSRGDGPWSAGGKGDSKLLPGVR
jgi:hypothetical protein